jgi:hypothetical protein
MNLDELLAPFLTWQFILSAILINVAVGYGIRIVRIIRSSLPGQRWFKALSTAANPLLGLIIAIVPDFLYGDRFIERAFVGMCAGFLSHFIYGLFIKRLLKQKDADEDGVPDGPASEADTKVEKPDPEKSRR